MPRFLAGAAIGAIALAVFLMASRQDVHVSTAAESSADAPLPPAVTADTSLPAASDPLLAPDFSLRTLDGEPFALSDQRGRVIVLNFWATWCPPCREEIPEFIEMQDEFGTEDVLFVGVSLDHVGERVVRDFAQEMEINYPIMLDDGSASRAYGPVASLPTTFLIGRTGELEGYAHGMVTREMIEPLIATLVAGESLGLGAD